MTKNHHAWILGGLIFFLSISFFIVRPRDIVFDEVVWKKCSESGDYKVRYKMIRSLTRWLNIFKLHRNEIVRVLGPPDRDLSDRCFLYNLGKEDGLFQIDDNWLELNFSGNGMVESILVRPD